MRSRILFLILEFLFLLVNFSYSQGSKRFPSPYPTWISNIGFNRIGVDQWAAGGAPITDTMIATAPFVNPAGLSVQKLSLYAEFGKLSTIKWMEDTEINGHYALPAFASVAFPFKTLTAGFGYLNYYESQSKFKMYVTTETQPEGTGESIDLKRNIKLNTFFSSVSYAPSHKISLGLTAGLNYLIHDDETGPLSSANGNGFGLLFIAGLRIEPFPKLALGYTLKYTTNIKHNLVFHDNTAIILGINPSISGPNEPIVVALSEQEFPFIAKFPLAFETGLKYQPATFVSLHAKVAMQKWPESSSYDDEDIVNFHLGSTVSLSRQLFLSLGYFSQDKLFYYPRSDYFNQKFLTAGLKFKINGYATLSACILDSHLLKESKWDARYYQTYFAAGMAVSR